MIKRFSVIYIGSNKCELVVGQRGKGCINILDRGMYPINFGIQSFTKQEISFKSVYALCQIINEYIAMSQTYDVEAIKLIGTTALREAKNKAYVLEQIKINTGGYNVEILEKDQEISLIYRHMILKCEEQVEIGEGVTGNQMLATISSGNVSVASIKNGYIDYHQTTALGYLKMKEILRTMEENTERFETLLTEFISINTYDISTNIQQRKIKKLVISSNEVEVIAKLCGEKTEKPYYEISVDQFKTLYDSVSNLTSNQLMKKFQILSQVEAETFSYTLTIYLELLKETKLETFILTPMKIIDAILDFEFQATKNQKLWDWIEASTLVSAKNITKKYKKSLTHAEFVASIALKIFDSLKKRHELGKRERQLLELSCYLMEGGSYIDPKDFWKLSQLIIENTELIGVSQREKRLMGGIVGSLKIQNENDNEGKQIFDEALQLTIDKLSAILKIAIALDKSYQQKISKIQCHFKEEKLILEVITGKNLQLEEYFFKGSRKSMENVYGIKPTLKIKRIER
ncbi:MAG: exopolyphosphatase [Eubacteriaceae bacterium]